MKKIKQYLKAEFINGATLFDYIFLAIGLILQGIAIFYTVKNPDGMTNSQIVWTSISGIAGIFSVVMCARGKISQYVFGFVQLIPYVFAVAIPNKLWGEVGENIFYFVTMVIGMFIWAKHYRIDDKGEASVHSKFFTKRGWIWSGIELVAFTVIVALILSHTNDPLPWFDSITTVAPLMGEILLMIGYREQWVFWAIEDVMSLGMFIVLGNWIMVAQYLFWTINTIYGWVKWTRNK